VIDLLEHKLYDHHAYIREKLVDMPEIVNWRWTDDFSEPDTPPPLARAKTADSASFTDA